MKEIITEIIGYVAAVLGTSLMIPQVIKSFKTRQTSDLSLVMSIFYLLNCVVWNIYGILILSNPMILCNSIGILIAITLLTLKIKYSGKPGKL